MNFQGRKCTNIFGDFTDLLYRLHLYVIWVNWLMQSVLGLLFFAVT